MTDDNQRSDAGEQPLFLDEPPGGPDKTKPAQPRTDELFLDENGPNPWDSLSPPGVGTDPATPHADTDTTTTPSRSDRDPKAKDEAEPPVTNSRLLAVVFIAMALGFAVVTGLLD